jgi:hypothetical protein
MTADERREILDLVAAGKLSADQAMKILQSEVPAVDVRAEGGEQVIRVEEEDVESAGAMKAEESAVVTATKEGKGGGRGRWLHIHVNDLKSGDRRVSVNVPLGFLRAGLAWGGNIAPELRRFSFDDLSAAILDEQDGMLVEVRDEEDGEHVQIFID